MEPEQFLYQEGKETVESLQLNGMGRAGFCRSSPASGEETPPQRGDNEREDLGHGPE